MRRFTKVALWGGLALSLAVGSAPAQLINEIVRGAANGFVADTFACGDGLVPCGLGYKLFCDLDPSDVGGAANPVDGIAGYRLKAQRYLTDIQATGNYPVCGYSGAGNNWYVLWDGTTGKGTAAHAGWYGGQAQRLFYAELGNSLSFNCLPVIASEACFGALDDLAGTQHGTNLADGSYLGPIGGLSPVPVPQFESRVDRIIANWEQATNQTVRDGAAPAIAGVNLYWLPADPTATDADWDGNGELLASLPADATSFEIVRGDPFFRTAGTFYLGTRVAYVGGHESNISANSADFGDTADLDCQVDPTDAPAIVDVERICVGVRTDDFGKEFLIVLVDIVGDPEGQVKTDRINFEVTMNTPGATRSNRQVRARALQVDRVGGAVALRFNTNFDNTGEPDRLLTENTTFDDNQGHIVFGIPLAELADSFIGGSISGEPGTRILTLDGRVAVPSAQDTFGIFSFTF